MTTSHFARTIAALKATITRMERKIDANGPRPKDRQEIKTWKLANAKLVLKIQELRERIEKTRDAEEDFNAAQAAKKEQRRLAGQKAAATRAAKKAAQMAA